MSTIDDDDEAGAVTLEPEVEEAEEESASRLDDVSFQICERTLGRI